MRQLVQARSIAFRINSSNHQILISVPTALADTLMRNENRCRHVSDVSMSVLSVMSVSGRPCPVFESRSSPLLPFDNGPTHRQVTDAAPFLPSSDGGSGLSPGE